MTTEQDHNAGIVERVEMPVRILRATFGIEGIPYSQFHIYEGDDLQEQVLVAKMLAEVYGDAFTQSSPETPQPSTPQTQQARPAPAQGGNLPKMLCPKHPGAVLMPSLRNKNTDFDEALGVDIPASWFHKDEQGASCSVWQSQAIRG